VLAVEGGVALGDLACTVEDGDLLWSWTRCVGGSGSGFLIASWGFSILGWGCCLGWSGGWSGGWLCIQLEDDLSWDWWRWVEWGKITGGGVWSSVSWGGVIVWDCCWFCVGAWGTDWSIEWSVGSCACWDFAVDTWGTVGSVAVWVLGKILFDFNWGPLGEVLSIVVFLSLHSNVLAEVFITVHSSGEKLNVCWSAGDTVNTSSNA